MNEGELTQEWVTKARAEITSFHVAAYVSHLETQVVEYKRQTMSALAELSIQKDHIFGLDDLLNRRPKDRRLAQILCDWMNLHQDKEVAWKICPCALCKETKSHMNALGDPIIHTARGWECTEGKEEFKTRNVAKELMDNQIKIGEPVQETEAVPMDNYPPKGEK